MRAYFFLNQYISSIQCGIQAQHTTAEMFLKYRDKSTVAGQRLWDWAENHKTSILLNGGYSSNLKRLIEFLESPINSYAWAYFEEEVDALNGALTCVGIVLPEHVYEAAATFRRGDELWSVTADLSRFDVDLCAELNACGLAS